MAVAAAEVLDQDRNGLVLGGVERKVGQQVVVPDPHGLENADRKIGGLHDGKDDLKEHLDRVAAVDHGRLLDLERDVLYKAGEHKDRQARAKAKVDKADVERRVEADAVRQIGQREHEHLERHDHREHEQVIEEVRDLVVDTNHVPSAHGAAHQDQHDRRDRDDERVHKCRGKALLVKGVHVVCEAVERLGREQIECRGGADCGRFLKRIKRNHEHGVDPRERQDRKENRERAVDNLIAFHYCCTSLDLVALSWIMEIATTRMQKITALA